jgi:hypothetical protein
MSWREKLEKLEKRKKEKKEKKKVGDHTNLKSVS